MDKRELEVVTNMHTEFKNAIDGTEGQVLPEDDKAAKAPAAGPD